MNQNFYCVIMAGGIGSRLWPVSKVPRPKQFLDIADTGKSFIRCTYDRFKKIVPKENIIVVTSDRYESLVKEQIPEMDSSNILLEPYCRDTAPCIAYATYTLLKRNPEATVVVTPSDHLITDEDIFIKELSEVLERASQTDVLMTLGITPTRPDSNYGYIQISGGKDACKKQRVIPVKTFTEKPDTELAKVFIESGEFYWNSGIFVWKAEVIKEELEKHLPQISKLFTGWENAIGSKVESGFIERAYTDCLKISIDYGVMEKTDRAWLFPVHFGWSDIGSWESLYSFIQEKDKGGNVFNTDAVLSAHNKDILVISDRKKKLAAISGLKDYIVIDTDNVLLICPKDDKRFKDFIAGIAMPGYEDYR